MNFKLHNEPYVQIPDVKFKAKQKIQTNNTPLCVSADPLTKQKIITGTVYIAHPRITRGFIRVCANEKDVDMKRPMGYVPVADLIKLNKELRNNG